MNTVTRTMTAVAAAGVVGTALIVPAASAATPRTVKHTGSCSASATWKLVAKADHGKIDVEYQVDSNAAGQSWSVTLKDNGTRVFHGTRRTEGASGSFDVSRMIANRSGRDHIVGIARYASTGESCRATVTF